MRAGTITLSIDSSYDNVFLVGLVVRQICRFAEMEDSEAFRVELCVVEAVNNVIQHGYEGRVGGEIEIEVRLRPEALSFEVRDRGRAMDAAALEASALEADDAALLEDNGRGLRIVRAWMDEVLYSRSGLHNRLVLTKRLSRDHSLGR
jgi:serine/threonine-protein kinase RsbW